MARRERVSVRSLLFAGLIYLGCLPAAASGQSRAFAEQVDSAALEVLAPVLQHAARDSLPVAALEAKALEGLVKGHAPDVIASVIERLADEYRLTRGALRDGLPERAVTGAEVVAASLARARGIPMGTILDVAGGTAPGSMDIPITVLGELVRRGVGVEDAAWAVKHAVAQEIPMSRITQIPGRLDVASRANAVGRPALLQALQSLGIPGPPPGRPPGPPGS